MYSKFSCSTNESGAGDMCDMPNRFLEVAFAKRAGTNEVDTS